MALLPPLIAAATYLSHHAENVALAANVIRGMLIYFVCAGVFIAIWRMKGLPPTSSKPQASLGSTKPELLRNARLLGLFGRGPFD